MKDSWTNYVISLELLDLLVNLFYIWALLSFFLGISNDLTDVTTSVNFRDISRALGGGNLCIKHGHPRGRK